MKKKLAGLLSIILVFALVFSLGACGKKDEDTTTTVGETTTVEDTTAQDDTTIVDETTVIDDETTQALEETTEPQGETAAPTTTNTATTATTANPTSAPTTAAEIVAYYNAAANKAKKDKPAHTLITTNIIGEITSTNGLLNSLIPKVVPMFTDDLVPTTVNIAKGDGSTIPVKGQSYGGKVEVSSLKSSNGAICVDKGSYYEITLNFKDEKLNSLPTDVSKIRHGQAFNLLTKKLVDDEIEKFSWIVKLPKFAPTYKGCYVKCKIEKSTGNILSGTYYCVNSSDVEAKVGFTTFAVTVNFGNKEEFTYKY